MPHLTLSLSILTLLAAAPALAVVNTQGDVRPVSPGGFGTPIGGSFIDRDADFQPDYIDTQGNEVFFNDADPLDATGGAVGVGGLAWNDVSIWVDYDTTQNILVGQDSYGIVEINGGSALRYQHLVLGGASEASDASSDLDLTTNGGGENFNYLGDVGNAGGLPTNGYGVLTVTGVGSVFNNAPAVIPADLQAALQFAVDGDPSEQVFDLAAAVGPDELGLGVGPTTRPVTASGQFDSFDVHVGLLSGGELNVQAGGRVEIQDALQVGTGSRANGTVTVDGAGSSLIAFGRRDFNANSVPQSQFSTLFPSYIGGNGRGVMTVSNGGRADFRNGLSIGAANSNTAIPTVAQFDDNDPLSSGSLTVMGEGSVVTVDITLVSNGSDLGNDADLAVGELRNLSNRNEPLPIAGGATLGDNTTTLGEGLLRVEAGGRVSVTQSGDLGVGYNGVVELRDGTIDGVDEILNDGRIDGYGRIVARTLDTTPYSVIRGGNPAAELGNPAAEPLRITLNGDVGGGAAAPALTNRGRIEGVVEINASGQFVNGEPTGPPGSATLNAGGTITATSFLNERYGIIEVDANEAIAIVSTSETPAVRTLPLQDGGIDLVGDGTIDAGSTPFYALNLGDISVNGGSFEVGRAIAPPNLGHVHFFRNARAVSVNPGSTSLANDGDETVGTITSVDGELTFRNGVYNTGVIAFTGGSNVVNGRVLNAGFFRLAEDPDMMPGNGDELPDRRGIDYDLGAEEYLREGTILISGNGTTVTFADDVQNSGTIAVGPFGSVANFLGNLDNTGGAIEITLDADGDGASAYIQVAGELTINGGSFALTPIAPSSFSAGFSVELASAASLSEDSLFTSLDLPELDDTLFWDVVYDTTLGEVRAEVVQSDAFGADFTGDGIVTGDDVDVWIRNAGIVSGASTLQGDADLDGDVDLADYDLLMAQLLTGTPVLFGGAPSAVVPEPAAALLMMLAGAAGVACRR